MSFCKPVREIEFIKTEWIPYPLVKMYADYTLEEFVLEVRNGSINSFMYDDERTEEDKAALGFMVDEVRETLIVNGFIRPEMMTLGNPELYFLLEYVIRLGFINDYCSKQELEFDGDLETVFMPYYFSNEDYEEYVFCYERIEAILKVLADFLDEDELYEVSLDIMSMSGVACDDQVLKRAKEKLVENVAELVPSLEKVFAMY